MKSEKWGDFNAEKTEEGRRGEEEMERRSEGFERFEIFERGEEVGFVFSLFLPLLPCYSRVAKNNIRKSKRFI